MFKVRCGIEAFGPLCNNALTTVFIELLRLINDELFVVGIRIVDVRGVVIVVFARLQIRLVSKSTEVLGYKLRLIR